MSLFRPCLKLALLGVGFIFCFTSLNSGHSSNPEKPDVGEMLNVMAEGFKNKIDDDFSVTVQFDFKDLKQSWHVIVEKGKKVTVGKGPYQEAQLFFFTTAEILHLIYQGKMTSMTACGKAEGSDYAPLDLKLAESLEFSPQIRALFYTFIQHFFNPSVPEKIPLGEEYSRVVHGAQVIPLYYYPGFRSAWYLLKKGEKLNQPGDTNPFPQGFIFIQGEGFAKIGDDTVEVKEGESYYIPPNSDHVVWTDSEVPLILIWLAWGDGA